MSTHDILHRLSETLASRRNADPENPIRPTLFAKGRIRSEKKIGEECAELIMAAKEGKRLNIVWESTDVIYHVLVLLAFYGLSIEDVSQEMRRREGISGIDKKRRGASGNDVRRHIEVTAGPDLALPRALGRRAGNERLHLLQDRARQIPSKKVFEDDDILAFNDITPTAGPCAGHPQKHITSLATAAADDAPVLGKILAKANEIAVAQGSPDGFRVIINTGRVGTRKSPPAYPYRGRTGPVGPMLKRI